MLYHLRKIVRRSHIAKWSFLATHTERLFVRVNDKNEWKFSIILFQNEKIRGFITVIHIMALKFNIVITSFKTCRRQISILNTKYYESSFEKLRVWKNDIMIIKLSENNFNSDLKNLKPFCGKRDAFDCILLWL